MDHASLGEWISYSFPHLTDVNMSRQRFACFLSGLKLLHVDRLLTPPWLRTYWKRSFLPEGTAPKLHSDRGTHFTGQVWQEVCAIWPVLQRFHRSYHPQSPGLVECTNGIIKTQQEKSVETLQIPWPKALPLVLLSLRATPFGTHELCLTIY